jgi:hypothetical protein
MPRRQSTVKITVYPGSSPSTYEFLRTLDKHAAEGFLQFVASKRISSTAPPLELHVNLASLDGTPSERAGQLLVLAESYLCSTQHLGYEKSPSIPEPLETPPGIESPAPENPTQPKGQSYKSTPKAKIKEFGI